MDRAQDESPSPRLYRKVAARLMDEIRAGRHPVGARMPAERDLSLTMGVSRPVVREALLALEVMGVVEVRIGSGAYVLRLPEDEPRSRPK
ncbi:FadR/GntR family transcriptional regulator [Novosphingobium resinovorum]